MKSGVKIVLKTIKNYKKSLKIVILDILDVLMWLICEILWQVFELFFSAPNFNLIVMITVILVIKSWD